MWKTDSIYLLVFVSGLVGGFGHCAGMCGPVVAALSMGATGVGRAGWLPHLLFSLGRTTTYAIVGGMMGFLGSFSGVAAPARPYQHVIMAALGCLMILLGLGTARVPILSRIAGAGFLSGCTERIRRLIRFISGAPGESLFFPAGMAIGLIPCGLSYTAYIGAAAAGIDAPNAAVGFLRGAALLLLFGAGTSPALILVARIAAAIPLRLRLHAHLIAAACMILAGSLFLIRAVR